MTPDDTPHPGPGLPPSGSPPPPSAAAHPSPRGSVSLQAAAAMNAGLQQEDPRRSSVGSLSRQRHSPQTDRRRSVVAMNLRLNDPSLPAPGELATDDRSPQPLSASPRSPYLASRDPHHDRAPSLGDLHQELESEQEAQVNRLLFQIRQQQLELQRLHASAGSQSQSAVAAEDTTPTSERSSYAPGSQSIPPSSSNPRSPSISHPRSSFDVARDALHRRSRTPSRGASSPRLRSTSITTAADNPDFAALGGRDEAAFYQAETQSMNRENQMLRHRIRELERLLAERSPTAPGAAETREPAQPSQLQNATPAPEPQPAAPEPVKNE